MLRVRGFMNDVSECCELIKEFTLIVAHSMCGQWRQMSWLIWKALSLRIVYKLCIQARPESSLAMTSLAFHPLKHNDEQPQQQQSSLWMLKINSMWNLHANENDDLELLVRVPFCVSIIAANISHTRTPATQRAKLNNRNVWPFAQKLCCHSKFTANTEWGSDYPTALSHTNIISSLRHRIMPKNAEK